MSRLPLLAATLIACGPDPALVSERDGLKAEVSKLADEKTRLERENDTLHAEVRKLKDAVAVERRRAVYGQLGLAEGQALTARFDTTAGAISCTLFPDKAPNTVLNFVQLAEGTKDWTDPSGAKVRRPLYTGTIFHRVIPNFMIQGGDPEGTGRGGPGYTFADETDNGLAFTEAGLLAMANRGPDTNGSQFFITDRGMPSHLDGKHTIFGKCENLDVVQKIAEAEKGAMDRPTVDQKINALTIVRGG